MRLPFLPGNKATARTKPAIESSGAPSKGPSLRGQMLVLLAGAVLLVAVPSIFVYLQTVMQLKAAEQRQSELAANLFASAYRQWVDRQLASADRVSSDPQLGRLLVLGTEQQIAAKTDALASLFPGSQRVRLLPPGIDEVDPNASPPISYAALDTLRQAESEDTPPPIEVHMSGTDKQHISLVRRIADPDSQRVAGNLMVSFSIQRLQKLLERGQAEGYVELQQVAGSKPLVLASRGPAQYRRGTENSRAGVEGTRWRVAYWAPAQLGADSRVLLFKAGAAGIAAPLLMLLIWFVFHRLGLALRSDQATLLGIVKDMRDGRVSAKYPSSLTDMHETIELMTRTASSGVPRPVSAGGHVKEEAPEAAPVAETQEVVDEVDTDLLFDANALDVGRVAVEENQLDPSIFRAYDIRGVVGESLSTEGAYEIGRAIGSEAYYRGEQVVLVGRDGRLSSPDLAAAVIKGLQATGRDVKDLGQVPTPVLYFATEHLDASSGVMVTGSHNPAEYNGFKIVLGGETLAGEAIDGLWQRIQSGDMLTGEGSVEELEVVNDYIEHVKGDVQLLRPVKVVVDCGNGVAGVAAPQLLRGLGCEVRELFCEVDGNFPNHHPDPGKTENLAALIQAVQEQSAELGIAFDGDGDRLVIVGSHGEIVWPDRLLMLLAMDVLSRNPGAQIIYDVKCSRHVASVVAEYGGEPLMWATGHSLIKAKMKESGALLAGEMSGHIYFRERWFGFDDGLYSAARLLEVLASDPRDTGEIFAALPESMNTPELSVPMPEGAASVFMEKLLKDAEAQFENAHVATIDGLRVEFDDGWGLVRASNTMPCLVMRFEADDELAMSRIQDEFRRVLLQVDPDLVLPFL